MGKKKKCWMIAVAVTACLLAVLLIFGTCGRGTLTEKKTPWSFGGL